MPPSVRFRLPSGTIMPPFASTSNAWATNACARSGPMVRTVRQIVARAPAWVSPSWAAMVVAVLTREGLISGSGSCARAEEVLCEAGMAWPDARLAARALGEAGCLAVEPAAQADVLWESSTS